MGGGGERVPAADRAAGRSSAPVTRRPHAGALRSARDAARRGRRSLARLPARGHGRSIHDEDAQRARARRRAGAGRRGAPRGGRLRARGGSLRALRARPARLLRRRCERRWSCGPPPPPTRCCRCWPPTPACACSWPPASLARAPLRRLGRRAVAARVRLRARPGARARRPRRARLLRRPDRGARARRARAARARRHRGGAGGGADRLGRPWSWSGTTASGYPVNARYRDYHRRTDPRPAAVEQRRRALRTPTAPALAREHARDFVAARQAPRRLRRSAAGRAALLRARHRAARPLVVRGPGLAARACVEEARASRGSSWSRSSEGLGAGPSRSSASWRASTWGSGKDLSTWDSPGVAELAFGARARGAARRWPRPRAATAPQRGAGARRARAAGAAGQRLGVPWSRASWPPTIRRSACAATPPRTTRPCAL